MAVVTLHPEQLAASQPTIHPWVAASAGTGKTAVLSARVLRLLLSGARPESILCLTFTRAGAAEMQERVNRTLARWVRANAGVLGAELRAMGERADPETIAAARRLFVRVLDAGGGGLQVQTIHGFCQSLLASFPLESGLAPGFELMDEAATLTLANATLTELLLADDGALAERVGALSVRLGEQAALNFLIRCAGAEHTLGRLPPGLEDWLRHEAGLVKPVAELMRGGLTDEFPDPELRALAEAMVAGTVKQAETGAALLDWLAGGADARVAGLGSLAELLLTAAGKPRGIGAVVKREPAAEDWQAAVCDALSRVRGWEALAGYIAELASALEAGRTFAAAFADAKRAQGLVDYDDLIRRAGALLAEGEMAHWVGFKLNERIDHLLVDEAQDTNAEQWAVIRALATEFFEGRQEDEDVARTLFVVGDFKQAIFGFQGTDPAAFAAARAEFEALAGQVKAPFEDVALTRSFRSTPAVLTVVDAVMAALGAEALEPEAAIAGHISATGGPGEVVLARPVVVPEEGEEAGEEGWLDDADRLLAQAIARQVRAWLDAGETVGNPPRPMTAGDVMVLVRARGPYVPLLVARLHEEGVPVAGVDRLFLSAPLAVQDLLAVVRWVLQPDDDLALGCILVSPLMGWSQDDLLATTDRPKRMPLWQHLRESRLADELAPLADLLNVADFLPPFEFLERILSGPINGRAKLLGRLGLEARDPIEELLNAATLFQDGEVGGLQRFLHAVDTTTAEIKREQAGTADAVRVLTVHGAKGLEAPVVILADATKDPNAGRHGRFDWRLRERLTLPALPPKGAEASGTVAEAVADNAAREAAEHRRLLYVALTRARERLLVVGKAPSRGELSPDSWHAAVAAGLDTLDAPEQAHPIWGSVRRFTDDSAWTKRGSAALKATPSEEEPLPGWLRASAPEEARPPRPLAPSRLGADDAAARPLGPARADAIERGIRLHALFERLPTLPSEERREAGMRWLSSRRGLSGEAAGALVDEAMAVMANPDWRRLWGADALAEAPLSAVVGSEVVTGTVDRLVVADDGVDVVDFKTGLVVPASADEVPAAYLRQLSAYRAALRVLFPDRPVRCALLYTAEPRWIALPDALLDGHAPGGDSVGVEKLGEGGDNKRSLGSLNNLTI